MRKYSFLVTLLIICGSLFAQSTYSGNLSVSDDNFFKDWRNNSDYYVGGCNAFPIGTFVNIKLPYSDDSVNVKIVRRIPEDGIFILIDKIAGEKLFLETGDVLPVRIQVINFIPPPIEELDEVLDPEPEIKGMTALSLGDGVVEDKSIPSESVVKDDFTIIDKPEVKVDTDIPTETALLPEMPELSDVTTPNLSTTEIPVTEETMSGIDTTLEETTPEIKASPEDKESTESISVPETTTTEEIITDDSTPLVIPTNTMEVDTKQDVKKDLEFTEITKAEEKPLAIFEDKLPVDSMFNNEDFKAETPVKDNIADTSTKNVKRIFFLEPANSKPPIGGVPDKDLVPVTTVDKSRTLEDGYYLQVGIYKTTELISTDTDKLDKLNYPYITVKEESSLARERLLVGPLQNDELGVIMLNLKNRGFKDFFRYKKKTEN